MAKNWHCIDCGKLIWNRYLRCKSCSQKGNKKQKGLFGQNNPNWKGGIAKNPYTHIFKKKISPFLRVLYSKCQLCNATTDLVVNHNNYNKSDNQWHNLIVLCRSCNSKVNFNRLYWIPILQYKSYIFMQSYLGI